MQWLLDCVLVILLSVTLFHALRLERALGVLKRDRAALEGLVDSFNTSTRQAETGIERLRATADGAGKQIARQTELASGLKDDLVFLIERGERLADRLDTQVRAGRTGAQDSPREDPYPPVIRGNDPIPFRERDPVSFMVPKAQAEPADQAEPRLRSQAERDLLKALRMAR
jgi:hypothetical protein